MHNYSIFHNATTQQLFACAPCLGSLQAIFAGPHTHTTHHTPPPYRPGMRHSSLLVGVALIIPAWPGCGTKNVAGLGLPGPQPAGLAQLVGAGPGPQPKPHRGWPDSWAKRRPLIGVLSS